MPPDGYTGANSARETDLNGLISIVMNCMEFTDDKNECEQAREVTRTVRHSPNLLMTDTELEDNLKALITFLHGRANLQDSPEVASALEDIKKLKETKLKITTEDITEVLQTYVRDKIKDDTRKSLDEMKEKRKQCIEEILQEVNKLRSTKSESINEILTAKNEPIHDINTAREISLDEMKRAKTATLAEVKRAKTSMLSEMNTAKTSTLAEIKKVETCTLNDSYETLRDELKEDLLIFNKKLYSTIPLSPLFEKKDTPLVGFYVRPIIKCVEYPMRESVRSDIKKEMSGLADIFKSKGSNEIYVASKAGIGKTVFCKRLAVAWCHAHEEPSAETTYDTEEDLRVMRDFDFIFVVPLREARRSDCDVDKMIQHQIIRHLSRSRRYTLDFLQDILTNERCLVILDGLDEWTHPTEKQCQTLNDVPHRKARQRCTILTTTRTWKFNTLSLSTNQIDSLVQITGLDDQAAEKLIENAVSKFNTDEIPQTKKNIKDFHHKLNKGCINKFKNIPLILIHLICLWHKKQTIGESYCQIFSNIIELHLQRAHLRSKRSEHPELKKMKIEMPKCVEKNKGCSAFYYVLKPLAQLAFHTFFDRNRELSLVFKIETAKSYLQEHFDFCLSTGLLTENKGVENNLIEYPRVSFAHKTFHEFLAALHVCSLELTEIKSIIEICNTVRDILAVSQFYIFLNGMCQDKAEILCVKTKLRFCHVNSVM